MPYGTDSFTDRYGDYKQPTVIDYDVSNKVVCNPQLSDLDLKKHEEDIAIILKEIFNTNAYFAGQRYISFTYAKDNKLQWDENKIKEMSTDTDWLFSFRKYIIKAKNSFILKK